MMGDPKKCGWMFIILGLLVLINKYYVMLDWWTFVGVIFVLKGIFMMSCEGGSCAMPKRRR